MLGKNKALLDIKYQYVARYPDICKHKYKEKKKMKNVFCCVKLTNQLLIKNKFPKSGLTYWRQVVDSHRQTPQ